MTEITHYVINENHPEIAELEQVIAEYLGAVGQWCRENYSTPEETESAMFSCLAKLAEAHPDVLWPAYSKASLN
jgi:hypothetical protein